jgi:uncharacterized membrane protein
MGFLCASLVGLTLIAGTIAARQSTMARASPSLAQSLEWGTLPGLIFFNLAPTFVLGWNGIGVAWAAVGVSCVGAGLWLRLRALLYFGAAIEAVAGISFLYAFSARITPSGSHAPIALSLAAIAAAWCLQRYASRPADGRVEDAFKFDPREIGTLSTLLLTWGMVWWAGSTVDQVFAFTADPAEGARLANLYRHERGFLILFILSLSSFSWTMIAHRERWRALAFFAYALPLAAATALLALRGPGPFAASFPTWSLFFIGHFFALRRLDALISTALRSAAHIAGVWVFIGVSMLAGRDALSDWPTVVEGMESAWPWLGGALAPSLYVWLAGGERGRFWPLSAYPNEYRFQAALPVALFMLAWFWAANAFSTGDALPLPYAPLFNPLEVALLLTLSAVWRWSLARLAQAGLGAEEIKNGTAVLACASFLAFITMAVCRAAHFWSDVPFHYSAMTASMVVQAGWSLVWSLFALVLMIGASRRGRRQVWIAGASLIAVVVMKLFLVELSDRGSLARIVSFVGVGILLLVVGYFSPLPPKIETGEET